MNLKTDIVGYYLRAHAEVVEAGYEQELVWLDRLAVDEVSDRDFLCETTWVILSSGFRSSVVAERFPAVCAAFGDFDDLAYVIGEREQCEQQALNVFAHPGKIAAIGKAASMVWQTGATFLVGEARRDVSTLTRIPFVGPITALHLARNIGVDVAKPDRHMTRLAERIGFGVGEMVDAITRATGDPIRLVDGVLWRHAVLPAASCAH